VDRDGATTVLSLAIKKALLSLFCMQSMKYINYNRKSSDSEDKQMLSIPAQQGFAEKHAADHGLSIASTINESKSAKIPNNRPGFRSMMQGIKSGKYNSIICWKLDRLSRNMAEGGEIIELLQQGKIKEIRTSEKVYLPSENAILLAVEFGSANQFSRDLSVNVKRGQKKKAQMGIPHGVAPFGFINDKREEKGNRGWLADTERINVLQAVFSKLLEGRTSARSIYTWMLHTYYPTTVKRKRIGGKPIVESYFYRMLRNPIYAGFFFYDTERYELDPALPRIITESQYYRIQRMLNEHTPSARIKHEATYVGLIESPQKEYIGTDFKFQLICDCKHKFSYTNRTHCPKCDVPVTSLKKPKYLSYTYYYNVPRKKRGEPVKMLSQTKVEAILKEMFTRIEFSKDMKRWIMENATTLTDLNSVELINKQRTEAVAGLNDKKRRLRGLLTDEIISRDEYLSDTRAIDEELEKLNVTDKEAQQHYAQSLEAAINAYDAFQSNTSEHKAAVLHILGSNLIWDEKELCIIRPKWIETLEMGLEEAMRKNPQFEPKKTLANKDKTEVFASVSPILLRTLEKIRESFYLDNT
jgi:site-specific DNA recombinase